MKIDKSLEEVWSWKDKIHEETKDLSMEEKIKLIKNNAAKLVQKYELNL